ncbi:hypothetical protein K0B04_02200 [Patescibacteria group bacterium]|nr:hypothetical protein [Patescibacteria group bacterium]
MIFKLISNKKFLSFLIFLVFITSYNPNTYALNAYIRPDGDTTTIQWTSTAATHYTEIDEAVVQPTAGTTTDYVNNGGTATNLDRYTMGTISSVIQATQVVVWVYGYSTKNNSSTSVDLYYNGSLQNQGSVTFGTSYSWQSVTFTGLTLSQSDIDSLEIEITGDAGGRTYYVATLYADVTYTAGSLSADIVDSSGVSVSNPSINMSEKTFDFSSQSSTGTFGVSSQKIRVTNTTAGPSWTLSLAAVEGSGDYWSGASSDYDYNDPTSNAGDGSDSDTWGGQMSVDPSVGTITPQSGCTNTGLSLGSSSSYDEESSVNSITLMSATSSASTNCYWDLTGVSVNQSIPPEQPAGTYSINMVLTIVAN